LRARVAGALSLAVLAAAAHAGTEEDVAAVIDAYRTYEESGDMIAQARLMTDDRAMMFVGGLLTGDNRKLMQEQQRDQDEFQARFPGVTYRIEIRDLQIRQLSDAAALATGYWYPTRVVPASLPAEAVRQLGPAKTPSIVAHVLVKQADGWKIAFTAFVPEKDESR
jgi:ketosteroid isomerase-like protein